MKLTSLLPIELISGAHELPEGQQGASNYVQRRLTMSGSDTFLIWTFLQVGNLPLWSLCVRVKHAMYCMSTCTRARPAFPRARCEFVRS